MARPCCGAGARSSAAARASSWCASCSTARLELRGGNSGAGRGRQGVGAGVMGTRLALHVTLKKQARGSVASAHTASSFCHRSISAQAQAAPEGVGAPDRLAKGPQLVVGSGTGRHCGAGEEQPQQACVGGCTAKTRAQAAAGHPSSHPSRRPSIKIWGCSRKCRAEQRRRAGAPSPAHVAAAPRRPAPPPCPPAGWWTWTWTSCGGGRTPWRPVPRPPRQRRSLLES